MTKSALSPLNIQTENIKFNKKDLTGVMINRLEINLETKIDELSDSKKELQKKIDETSKSYNSSLNKFVQNHFEKDFKKLVSCLSKVFVDSKKYLDKESIETSAIVNSSLKESEGTYSVEALFNLKSINLDSVTVQVEITDDGIIDLHLESIKLKEQLGELFSEQADAKKKLRDLPKLERRLNAQITEQALKDTDGGEEILKQMEDTVNGTGFSDILSLNA